MAFWVICILSFLIGAYFFRKDFFYFLSVSQFARQIQLVQRVVIVFQEIEETLMTGLIPREDRWNALSKLGEPWKTLSMESLKHLRDSGGALLPTLKRLRSLAEEHRVALVDARAKSSQAFAQSIACASLVPLLGLALYELLPGLEENLKVWCIACGVSFFMTGVAALWLFQMAESARWGGLSSDQHAWVLASQCAGERFLACVRSGLPPDLAWTQSVSFLAQHALGLAVFWGHSVWEAPQSSVCRPAAQTLIQAGSSMRKAIQVSLMEGRPCTERVESVLLSLRQDLRAQIERELALLGTRALKPLFLCVAPALIGLLAYGLWLATIEVGGIE